MVFNPARPEITTVTSELLQLKIRQLLPSQDGFGADLAAQNVIVPIVDLTEAAEGSDVPQYLQTALAHGSQTAFNVNNATTTLITTAGFFRIIGNYTLDCNGVSDPSVNFSITDGTTSKKIWEQQVSSSLATNNTFGAFDFTIFLRAGDSLTGFSSNKAYLAGSHRQVAEENGTLVNPSGFTPQ